MFQKRKCMAPFKKFVFQNILKQIINKIAGVKE